MKVRKNLLKAEPRQCMNMRRGPSVKRKNNTFSLLNIVLERE